jgi:hypothetical protein
VRLAGDGAEWPVVENVINGDAERERRELEKLRGLIEFAPVEFVFLECEGLRLKWWRRRKWECAGDIVFTTSENGE